MKIGRSPRRRGEAFAPFLFPPPPRPSELPLEEAKIRKV